MTTNTTTIFHKVFFLSFNFFSTVGVTLLNKICFERIQFRYPATLCNIHFAVTWLGVELLQHHNNTSSSPKQTKKPSTKLKLDPKWYDPNFLSIIIVVGTVTPLNNTSLQLNSVGFYQIFKLLLTPVIVLLQYLLDHHTISLSRSLSLLLVCIFVFISTNNDIENTFSFKGTLCAIIWIPLASLYKVQWNRLMQRYDCTTLQLMHWVMPRAILVQTCMIPLVDPPGVWTDYQWTLERIMWISASGMMAFMVNVSGFLVMGNVGALAHVLLGQLKTCVIMLGAYVFLGSRYGGWQLGGAVGAIGSIVLYTYVTVNDQEVLKRRKRMVEEEILRDSDEDDDVNRGNGDEIGQRNI